MHGRSDGLLDTTGRFSRSKSRDFRNNLPAIFTPDELQAKGIRWLDVGCGFGELLLALRHVLPSDAVIEGIEPSERKCAVAQKFGLNVRPGTLSDVEPGRYNVISMINVVSHLPDPRSSFESLARLLGVGGRLILLTGNGADVPRSEYPGSLYLPDHLLFLGKSTLTRLLESTGFRVEASAAYRSFFQESELTRQVKNIARAMLGKPAVVKRVGDFRDMFVKARVVAR
jgi:2-polyprenyl-3-methyl-5-hydroxy-6-metoxy-1,4-benzoquinol methylase